MSFKKFLFKISILLLILFFPVFILAQDISTSEAGTNLIQNRNTNRIEAQERIKAQKETLLEKRNEFQLRRQEAVENFKAKREQFKEKLASLKDENKQIIIERVDTKITNVNKIHIDRFNNILERLSNILDRAQSRIDLLKDKGKDVTSVDSLVETALQKISEAQVSVNEQAGKDYIIEIGNETNLGQTVSSVHIEFKEDIKAVRDIVKEARRAVLDVILEIKDLNKN